MAETPLPPRTLRTFSVGSLAPLPSAESRAPWLNCKKMHQKSCIAGWRPMRQAVEFQRDSSSAVGELHRFTESCCKCCSYGEACLFLGNDSGCQKPLAAAAKHYILCPWAQTFWTSIPQLRSLQEQPLSSGSRHLQEVQRKCSGKMCSL